jgi:hypothetical protein
MSDQIVKVSVKDKSTRDMLQRLETKHPKPEDVQALRELFEASPDMWRMVGDMTHHALSAIVEHAAGGNTFIKESLLEGYRAICRDLGHAESSALERLLIEQVALCWMRHNDLERRYTSVTQAGQTINQADYWERRLAASQRRYLRACETLARVQRMDLPAIQINVAEQQVNMQG